MPLVMVTVNRARPQLADDSSCLRLASYLRGRVAKALSCDEKDGELTSDDVEVELSDYDPRRHIGGEQFDVRVMVIANDYPSRRENLDERRQSIERGMCAGDKMQDLKGFVWVLLAPASFGEFGSV